MELAGIHRYLLLFAVSLLTACGSTRTFGWEDVDEPPLLPLVREWDRSFPPTAENRFQLFVYSNLKYPVIAREPGIQANLRASYEITNAGSVKNLTIREIEYNAGALKVNNIKSDTIIQLAFRIPQIDFTHGKYAAPPSREYSYQDTLAGHRALLQEVEKVFRLLPHFQPARKNGKPVAVRRITDFIFRLE